MEHISKRIHNCCHEITTERKRITKISMMEYDVIQKVYKKDPEKRRKEKAKTNERHANSLYEFILNACRRYNLRSEYVFKIMHPSGVNWLNSIKKSIVRKIQNEQKQ